MSRLLMTSAETVVDLHIPQCPVKLLMKKPALCVFSLPDDSHICTALQLAAAVRANSVVLLPSASFPAQAASFAVQTEESVREGAFAELWLNRNT